MFRILATIFAALLGLAFGSFLNVCLSRWPEDESIVKPRSHCRTCTRPLLWFENIPLLSWLALGGRCRTCNAPIPWRYPLVEASVGLLWALVAWNALTADPDWVLPGTYARLIAESVCSMSLMWVLVALAALDAEHLWLPDFLTIPGIALGFIVQTAFRTMGTALFRYPFWPTVLWNLGAIVLAAALILLIRWVYWLFRRQEGIGLGDAKLMALLAAWLGLPGALLSFFLGVTLGALLAVPLLMTHRTAQARLPLGTFLSIGGIVTALWGQQILSAYLTWSGF
jgi:leader peptidase (prepilin peptidase) / N-methyltransferase